MLFIYRVSRGMAKLIMSFHFLYSASISIPDINCLQGIVRYIIYRVFISLLSKPEARKSSFLRNRLILFTRPLTFILEIKDRKREEDDHEVRNSRRKYFRYDVTSALFITGFPFVHVVVGAERHVVQKRFSAEISDQCMLTAAPLHYK